MKSLPKSLGWGGALIVALTILAYSPSFRGDFIMDDDQYVTENDTLHSLDGLGRIWTQFVGEGLRQYYPLVFTTFWVEYHLWSLQSLGYHLVNVVLHATNAILLWLVLRRLELRGAGLAAAVFALHPVQVETVAWISELKNLTSGLFSLLAVLAFLRFRPLSPTVPASPVRWRSYVLALLMFFCALLCKTAVCGLPAVLMILIWWRLGRVTRRDVLVLLPWFLIAGGLGLVTVWLEQKAVRVDAAGLPSSLMFHWLLAGRAAWFYAGKVFWPHPLTFIYPRWKIDASAPWQHLFPWGVVVVLAGLWRWRTRIGRGPLAANLCYLVMLSPALGVFNIDFFRYSYVADRFQYLACIALIASVVGAGPSILQGIGWRGSGWAQLAATVLGLTLGTLTWRQAHDYQGPEMLWRHTLRRNPNAWIAHSELGLVLWQNGKPAEAVDHMEQALRINPDYAEGHNNLGNALFQAGNTQEAIIQYREALRIKPALPGTCYNLGVALERVGRTQEAMAQWEQALRLQPDYVDALNSLAIALCREGKIQEAESRWDEALRLKPDYAEVHYNLAVALEQAGKIAEARVHYEQALRIKPDFVRARDRLAHLPGDR